MSGYKHATVTISREEYQRLHEADMKKRFKEFNRIRSHDSGQNEMVLGLIRQLEERESQLQAVLSTTGQGSSQTDNGLLQNLLEQNAIYYENLVSTLRNSNWDLQNSLDSVTNELFTEMNAGREYIYQALQSIMVDQQSVQNSESIKAEAARQWHSGCIVLIEFIQSQFDHERFSPGRLNRILRNLSLAENNYANGFFESSLQASQQNYIELTDLIAELEQQVLCWQTAFEKTIESIDELIFQMVSNGKVNAVGLQGEELTDLVDLNYWTDGRFSQLLSHSRQLSTNLMQDQGILALEDLDRVYNQIIPVIRESFESMVYDARLSALNSQLRMNIAEKALQALENHGFCLENSGYSDNDMRSQFNAHLACPDGSEVTINVLPTDRSAEELSNEIVVITTHPYLKTDHEAMMQWDELSYTLGQYNLKVSRPEINTNPTPLLADHPGRKTQIEQKYSEQER